MPENRRKEPTARSPMAGCAIITAGIVSMLFLVGYVIWVLFKLDEEIAKFTNDTPRELPVPELVDNAAALNALKAKLDTFALDAEKGEPASLALTAAEINLAIAAFPRFEDLRGSFHVDRIEAGRLRASVSYRMNGRPLSGEFRYLNGTLVTLPKLAGGEIILEIDQILVPGSTVPEGFIGQMSPHRITNRYLEDPVLGPYMNRLTAAAIDDGRFVLTITPGVTPPDAEPESLRPYAKRTLILFGLIATIFVVVLFLARSVARRKPA
ncbi:MAG: hypothetical protein HKN82_02490 [Akkermansiaceae bacterium]|nr:hypothetical protein [Akkermansiaceae bacterium]NNM28504.1 hypothetical protein [Akkermansiaceae bacterium]